MTVFFYAIKRQWWNCGAKKKWCHIQVFRRDRSKAFFAYQIGDKSQLNFTERKIKRPWSHAAPSGEQHIHARKLKSIARRVWFFFFNFWNLLKRLQFYTGLWQRKKKDVCWELINPRFKPFSTTEDQALTLAGAGLVLAKTIVFCSDDLVLYCSVAIYIPQ